jgi:hypothetical protein
LKKDATCSSLNTKERNGKEREENQIMIVKSVIAKHAKSIINHQGRQSSKRGKNDPKKGLYIAPNRIFKDNGLQLF